MSLIAGILSTCIFAFSNLPMLLKAKKTQDLKSYSLLYIVMNNIANMFHWFYIADLPFGPIWVLHSFYTVSMLLMLVWCIRYQANRSS